MGYVSETLPRSLAVLSRASSVEIFLNCTVTTIFSRKARRPIYTTPERIGQKNRRHVERSRISLLSRPATGATNKLKASLGKSASHREHIFEKKSPLRVCRGFQEAVGSTPLIYLREASKSARCEIFAKCEFNNPGGSVKDRPAMYIIDQAEKEGSLSANKNLIVEGSAGNTAIGLALASKARDYHVVCVIPENQTQEKKEMLKICGVTIVEVPFNKVWHPNHFVKFSGRLASVMGACWGNQFDNLANKLSHVETTGPEIWEQMNGQIDGFVSAAGTGGTVAGVSEYLRSQCKDVMVALADIPGSALYRYYTEGTLKAEGSSIVENIGQGRITGQLKGFKPDAAFEITDEESLQWTHSLLEKEGLAVGMTSGVNVAAAIRLGLQLGPGHRICTLLCDFGTRYGKKQWNASFLKEMGLPCLQEQSAPVLIHEAVHVAYAPAEEVAQVEAEHFKENTDPRSKI